MIFTPYCMGYATWKNNDGSFKTRQTKKFPKTISKKVLQSFFRNVAIDELMEKNNLLNQTQESVFIEENFIFIGRRMIELFKQNDVYNLKSDAQRKSIEDYLRFHIETIEVEEHFFDKKYFEISDDFVVLNIKNNAPVDEVWYFFRAIADNLEDQTIRFDKDKLVNFMKTSVSNTEFFKHKSKKYQNELLETIEKFTDADKKSQTISMHWNEKEKVENFIIKQTLNYHKKRS